MVSEILHTLWNERVGTCHRVKREQVVHFPRRIPGVPRTMLINATYNNEQEFICFMGGELNGSRDMHIQIVMK